MKSFQQFQEDVGELRRNLNAIEKQDSHKKRLHARRLELHKRAKSAAVEFSKR